MNIAMEQTEEYVNGQLKAKYGDAFIRGNNGSDPQDTMRSHPPVSKVHTTQLARSPPRTPPAQSCTSPRRSEKRDAPARSREGALGSPPGLG